MARATTAENKLNALLGISEKVADVATRTTGRIVGVTEDEIQDFREAQGLIYFLQAPALFEAKKCKRCNDPFLVSRKYVAFCSYTCIRLALAEQGIKWSKGHDLEALAQDKQVYDGNEPIWIRRHSLEKLQGILTTLLETDSEKTEEPTSLIPTPSPPESSTPSMMEPIEPFSSPPTTTTPSNTLVVGKRSSTTKKPRRKISFGD